MCKTYIECTEAYVNGSWERGARIVIPSGHKMNEAQAYGSALTYARRYTALSVLGIACDDDNKIEVHSKEESDAQVFENMKKDCLALYEKAGGKDFDKYCEQYGGFTTETYPKIRTAIVKQITDNAEKEKKKA